jgi:hypothetical protein
MSRGEIQTARELAEQTLNFAQRTQDPIALLEAYSFFGPSDGAGGRRAGWESILDKFATYMTTETADA